MAEIIIGIITGAVAVLCFVYVSFTARQKGPILTNEYLLGTEQERRKVDKKASYHLLTVVFGCLGVVFALVTLFIFTDCKWTLYVTYGFIIFDIVYAVVKGVNFKKKKSL